MANTTGIVQSRMQFTQSSTLGSGVVLPTSIDVGSTLTSVANGTTIGDINLGWYDSRTLTATSVTLDLTALAAASTNTGAAAFSTILGYRITNDAAADSANNLTIGDAASTQFPFDGVGTTQTFVLAPGGTLQFWLPNTAGIACGTNKSWKFDAGAGTVPMTILLLGRV